MAASAFSRLTQISQAGISSETFDVTLDNATFVDLLPIQIKAIYDFTITPLNAGAFTNYPGLVVNKFGSAVTAFTIGDPGVRITAGAGVFLGTKYIVTLYGNAA